MPSAAKRVEVALVLLADGHVVAGAAHRPSSFHQGKKWNFKSSEVSRPCRHRRKLARLLAHPVEGAFLSLRRALDDDELAGLDGVQRAGDDLARLVGDTGRRSFRTPRRAGIAGCLSASRSRRGSSCCWRR